VWLVGSHQRAAADDAFSEAQAADEMLVAMLDQETGLLGYVASGDEALLRRYQAGRGASSERWRTPRQGRLRARMTSGRRSPRSAGSRGAGATSA
jgi:hypothetical protein